MPSGSQRNARVLASLWLATGLIAASCARAPSRPVVSPATPVQLRPRMTPKHGSVPERVTQQQLERLLDDYDLSPWLFTPTLEIDDDVIPHSHPVLTLSTRHVKDDLLLLSTYIHEQSHWYFTARRDQTHAAMAELEARFPDMPVGFPDGASDHDASYEHLCVNLFEYDALRSLVGELRARQVLEFWATDHYRTIYRTVLDNTGAIALVLKRHGLAPPTANASPGAWRQRGRPASIAAASAGSSGVVRGSNRVICEPSAETTNFSKFQRMSPLCPPASAMAVSSR
jgi:hypothetical protein